MKSYLIAAALAALTGVHAADPVSTTITCSGCPSVVPTMPDIVTRQALPTTSCTEKPLTVVSNTNGASGVAAPTGSGSGSGPTPVATPPVSGASIAKMGSAGGLVVAAAMAASYLL